MNALTHTRPKPMIEVGGRALVDHALEQIDQIPRKFANLHYLPETLNSHLTSAGISTIYEPTLLETGGGLKNALPELNRDVVFTMNTDAVWQGPNAGDILAQAWDPERMDALLLTVPLENSLGHLGQGDFDIAHDGRLTRGRETVYTGLQIVKTAPLIEIKDDHFSLNVIWNQMFETKRLFGIRYPGVWCDVGHPEGIEIAEHLLERN